MIDKLLGSDEEIKSSSTKPRGGELVELDGESEPCNSSNTTEAASTAGAQAVANIDQTADDYDEEDDGSTSYDEEEYENDFHEILEEVVRHQADLEEDRDDDPDLNESDTSLPSFTEEAKGGNRPKGAASNSETTQDPNMSHTDSVTKKRVVDNPATTASAGELQNLVDGVWTPAGDEETPDEVGEMDGGRESSTEERIWQ